MSDEETSVSTDDAVSDAAQVVGAVEAAAPEVQHSESGREIRALATDTPARKPSAKEREAEHDATHTGDGSQGTDEVQVLGRQLWRIVPLVKPYWRRFSLGVVGNGVARVFDLVPFIIIGIFVDALNDARTDGTALPTTWEFAQYGLMVLAAFIGLAVFQGLSNYAWETLAQYIQHDLRMGAFDSLLKMEIRYFEDRQSGDLMSVLSSDVNQLENFLSDSTTSIIRMVVTFGGVFAVLMWMSWKLAIILFMPMLLIVPGVYYFSTRVQSKYRRSRQSFGDINAVLTNNISGMGVVQAYTAESYELERVGKESESYLFHQVRATLDRLKFTPMIYVVAGLAMGSLITAGGWLVGDGDISVGQFVTFILMATRMTMPLFIFGMLVNQIQRSEASARRVFAIVDLEPTIVDREDASELEGEATTVAFEKLTFGYPGTDQTVLNGISFELKKDQTLGIVGPTGAGKSTIIKMLLRYYEPDSGCVLMNGENIQEHTLHSMRQQIGYVSQDVYLFHGSVRENITYGKFDASDEEIEEAARLAGAADFIDDLPNGYDTIVGDRGVKLSGGQRQRVSLARALLRQPALLVLDEATSAVDTKTEEIIQRNLNEVKEGRMTVAVAHRLSTIRNADQILVLVEGVVVERGSHDELIEQNGVYADLWAVQSGELDKTTGAATSHDD